MGAVVVVAVFAKHHRSRIVKRECIRGLHLQIAAVCNLLYPRPFRQPSATMTDNLGKVRRRLEQATELIESTDEKIISRKAATLEAQARNDKLEVDLQSSKRRIILIQEDLRVTKERLQGQEEKLKSTQDTSEEVEKARDEMEAKENEAEGKIQLENNIKDMKRKNELNAGKLVESERKQGVCTDEIAKIRERAEKSEARVKVLEGVIAEQGKTLSEI